MDHMGTVDYPPGVPCWVDLSTPDVDAAIAFYGQLFGWEAQPTAPNTGGYRMFHYQGQPVAAVMPLMSDDQPVAWSHYVSVADCAATTQAVEAAGGKVVAAPMDVMEQGVMAVYTDPEGAVFGCWQPKAFRGAELVNEPNTFCWTELASRDLDSATRFYPRVFGWQHQTDTFEGGSYTTWRVGDRPVGGMMPMGSMFPPDVPPHWGVYFAVTDVDASIDRLRDLGGTTLTSVMSADVGRFAGVTDPHGASFTLIQLAER